MAEHAYCLTRAARLLALPVLLLLALAAVPAAAVTLGSNDSFPFEGQASFISGLYSNPEATLPYVMGTLPESSINIVINQDGTLLVFQGYYESFMCLDDKTFILEYRGLNYPTMEQVWACTIFREANDTLYRVSVLETNQSESIECPRVEDMEKYIAQGNGTSTIGLSNTVVAIAALNKIEGTNFPVSSETTCKNVSSPAPSKTPDAPLPDIDPGHNTCDTLPAPPTDLKYGSGVWIQQVAGDAPGTAVVHNGLEYGLLTWEDRAISGTNRFDVHSTRAKVIGFKCINETTDNFVAVYQRRWMNGTVEAGYWCRTRTIDPATETMTIAPIDEPGNADVYTFERGIPGYVVQTCSKDGLVSVGGPVISAPAPAPTSSGALGGARGVIWTALLATAAW